MCISTYRDPRGVDYRQSDLTLVGNNQKSLNLDISRKNRNLPNVGGVKAGYKCLPPPFSNCQGKTQQCLSILNQLSGLDRTPPKFLVSLILSACSNWQHWTRVAGLKFRCLGLHTLGFSRKHPILLIRFSTIYSRRFYLGPKCIL